MIQRETSVRTRERTIDPAKGPVRTCIGCRRRELAVELLRVVAVGGGNGGDAVTVDAARTLPGRGAWLHRDPECLQAAIRRRAFGRALRITGTPDITAVLDSFRGQDNDEVTGSRERQRHPEREQVAKNMSTP
ncbi:MAG: YlxR family protein [Mycolicibacterium sp.]